MLQVLLLLLWKLSVVVVVLQRTSPLPVVSCGRIFGRKNNLGARFDRHPCAVEFFIQTMRQAVLNIDRCLHP